MSVIYCHECDRQWDVDFHEECPTCAQTLAEWEEAEDRRRDNPLEPDYRRLGQ